MNKQSTINQEKVQNVKEQEKRKSLYDVVKLKREIEGQALSRLFYIAMSQKLEMDQTIKQIEVQIKELQQQSNTQITGYLLVKSQYVIHLIEGTGDVINSLLRTMYNQSKTIPLYSFINILTFNEEVPNRYFKKWNKDSVILAGTVPQETDKNNLAVSERVGQVYLSFCQAGLKSQVEEVRLQNEILLTNEDLYLMSTKQFTSLDEYYEIYLDDLEINLDIEHLYPYQPSITRLLEFQDTGALSEFVNKYN